MKLTHSLGFLLIGAAMFFLPRFAPSVCSTDLNGFSVRAAWLHLMGFFQIGIGASYMLRKAGTELAIWLERWPELIDAQGSASELKTAPHAGVPAFSRPVAVQPMAEVIPVDFKPTWSEQRGAA